LIGGLKFNS